MAKSPNGVRIHIDAGYSGKFILPEGTSADAMAILVNAIPVEQTYCNGEYQTHPDPSKNKILMTIVNIENMRYFVDARSEDNHTEYDIIIDEVKSKIKDTKHAVIVFGSSSIKVGKTSIEYKDLADPEVDPEVIISEIVDLALANPRKDL